MSIVDSGLYIPIIAAVAATKWFILSFEDKYLYVILKFIIQNSKRKIIANRMVMLPIYFDAKINMIPVTVRIKLNIFNVFDWIFKFDSMESSPFCANYNIYGYSNQ